MLYERMIYLADISYLSNTFIREYDMSKANINVLYTKGLISKEVYDDLFNAERMVRQRYVGNAQRENPAIVKALQEGIIEAKKKLFEANNLQDYSVLSIKNDAVFVISKELLYTEFSDYIKFKCKNIYTGYYKIITRRAIYELYYYYNKMTKEEKLDIKGINDDNIYLYIPGMIQLLKDIFFTVQTQGPIEALKIMKDIYNQYINLQLPFECYRRFGIGDFKLKVKTITGYPFSLSYPDESFRNLLDISYNIDVLAAVQKLLINMYFSR